MRTRSRLLLATLVVVPVLALAVGAAAGSRLRLSSSSFAIRWREFNVPTGVREEERTNNVRSCPLTLTGSFHTTTMAKILESLVGYVTSAQMGTCIGTGGTVTLLRTGLPWHLRYKAFSGTLPNITSFRLALVGFSMSIEVPVLGGVVCLIRSTPAEPLNIDFTREAGTGRITSAGGTNSVIDARDTNEILCDGSNPPLSWVMGGNGTFDNGSGASVTVTLI